MKNIVHVLMLILLGYLVGLGIGLVIGYNNILFTKSDNSIHFEWEGLEKDIPEDGSYIQITGTDENTVYLNAIDE